MAKTRLVALLVIVLLGFVCADINSEFMEKANGMVGDDPNTAALLSDVSSSHDYFAMDEPESNLQARVDTMVELGAGLRRISRFRDLPPIRFYPWKRLAPLKYGRRLHSLTFVNSITSGSASVNANGLYSIKENGVLKIRTATGSSVGVPIQQFHMTKVRKCNKVLFWDNCHDEDVRAERGLFHHEAEAITSRLQNEAARAMVRAIQTQSSFTNTPEGGRASREVGPPSPEGGRRSLDGGRPTRGDLRSLYLDESNRLRSMYKQLEYDYSDMAEVTSESLVDAINTASLGLINDGWVHERMRQVASSTDRSSFLVVPSNDYFFVFSINNFGGSFTVRTSSFRVEGQLPVGSFVSSTGNWHLERSGQGSSPSIHQILGIFPALK